MRRPILILALLGLLSLAAVAPAAAAPPEHAGSGGANPSELCVENIYVELTPFGAIDLFVPSFGGCVSSWASGRLSTAAYVSQCKALEAEFIAAFGSAYPYAFYGRYLAENRADCVYFLRGFHTGTIEPGPGT
jgi:hypothetical protein